MRNMSFSLTEPQLLAGKKTVTRRRGWWNLKPGDVLRAVRKSMGLKKGEKVHVLGTIEVVIARREKLAAMVRDTNYGLAECKLEGFEGDPEKQWPDKFVEFFAATHDCEIEDDVNRIEFNFTPCVARAATPALMVEPPVEIIADCGDLWIVRDCDDEDGCVIVDHYLTRVRGSRDEGCEPEPTNTMHVPTDVLTEIVKALAALARAKEEAAGEK